MKIAAVVVAAGKSERMGKNKLLLKLGGKRLIDHILDALEASKVDEIIVVLGNKPQEMEEIVKPRLNRVKTIVNVRYEEGMASSFRTGLKQVENADAAFLVLGDQLILDSKFIDAMIEQMEIGRGKTLIVSPIYERKKGHPLLFSKELFSEMMNLKKGQVTRDIVHRHMDKLLTVKADRWTVIDIDTPEDFEKAKKLVAEKKQLLPREKARLIR